VIHSKLLLSLQPWFGYSIFQVILKWNNPKFQNLLSEVVSYQSQSWLPSEKSSLRDHNSICIMEKLDWLLFLKKKKNFKWDITQSNYFQEDYSRVKIHFFFSNHKVIKKIRLYKIKKLSVTKRLPPKGGNHSYA